MSSDIDKVARIERSSSAHESLAWVSDSQATHDLLFSLVVCEPNGNTVLGIIEDVFFAFDNVSGGYRKTVRVRNLLSLDQSSSVKPVRDAPRLGCPVYLASGKHLKKFFPVGDFLSKGYLGFVRGTDYPLPLDLDTLCFANTAILAGINHGKSHLAALLASQVHLTHKKVLVVDPSGEWSQLMTEQQKKWPEKAHAEIRMSVIIADEIQLSSDPFIVDPIAVTPTPPQWLSQMWECFRRNEITVLDVSLAKRTDMKAEAKLDARCKIVYHIQQILMREASSAFESTKKQYAAPTCIVLEEAHQFVPHEPQLKYQKLLVDLFSMSTKEYRKCGSGHVFIDQSLKAIHENLQIQTFLLGATTQPTDAGYLENKLGTTVAAAVERTIGGTPSPSWVVLGAATPVSNLPWEIVSFRDDELSIFRAEESV